MLLRLPNKVIHANMSLSRQILFTLVYVIVRNSRRIVQACRFKERTTRSRRFPDIA